MKKGKLIILVSVGLILFFLEAETMSKAVSINRARHAIPEASSSRQARLKEVPGRNKSILLYNPLVRNHWISEYAVDSDPLTFWASKKSSGEWLELKPGNRLMPEVPIAKIVIRWGDDPAGRYSILARKKRGDFKNIKEVIFEPGKERIFEFDPPVVLSRLRFQFHASKTQKGISIREIEIYGPADELMPSPAVNLQAELIAPNQVKLSWSYDRSKGGVYLFKLFRGTQPDFPLDRAHLIAEVDLTEFIDRSVKPGEKYYYKVVSEGFSGDRNLSARIISIQIPRAKPYYRMRIRGVIEGFYNQPWSHPARVRLLRFLAQNNFNYYIYAPKNDPYHRQLWRESYPKEEKRNFQELIDTAKALGITINYGISPGLDIDYTAPKEVDALKEKLREMFELGFRSFTLCLDDIPGSNRANQKMAEEQVKLVNQINQYLKSLEPNCELFFVPTVYSRPYSYWQKHKKNFARYLETLSQIDPKVLIMWTGPSVTFSDVIDLESALEYKKLWRRPILIWDNYPVNDVGLQQFIFLGPYTGRDLKLGEAVFGIFSNPMFLPEASKIPLYTVGRYFSEKDYQPWKAYQEAINQLGKGAEQALKDLADCLLAHPMFPSRGLEILPIKKALDRFWEAYKTSSYEKEKIELEKLLLRYSLNPEQLSQLENQRLWLELKPASEKLSLYARASLCALEYLEAKEPAKRKELKAKAKNYLKSARKIPVKIAETELNIIYKIIGAKTEKNVFESFIQKAFKK